MDYKLGSAENCHLFNIKVYIAIFEQIKARKCFNNLRSANCTLSGKVIKH